MKEYIKERKRILKELGIKLTKEQNNHLRELTREFDVDNYLHDVLINHDQNDSFKPPINDKHRTECEKISSNLRLLKRKRGLSNKHISNEMKIPKPTIDAYFAGQYMPSDARIKLLAKYFKLKSSKDLFMNHDKFKEKYGG